MRELRDLRAEGLIKQNLLVRVRQVILAANHMRDLHLDIVQDHGQVIEGVSVRAEQHQVFYFRIGAFLGTVNDVGES